MTVEPSSISCDLASSVSRYSWEAVLLMDLDMVREEVGRELSEPGTPRDELVEAVDSVRMVGWR